MLRALRLEGILEFLGAKELELRRVEITQEANNWQLIDLG
jgi:hypothetical protein